MTVNRWFAAPAVLAVWIWAGASNAKAEYLDCILYAADARTQKLHVLSPLDGSPTLVGAFGVGGYMAALAYDAPGDVLYGTTTRTDNLYAIDPSTGQATLIGPLGVSHMHGLAFDNLTGTLYGSFGSEQGDGLYRIDTSTGAATLVGHIGHFYSNPYNSVHGLAFHPLTGELYGAVPGPDNPLFGSENDGKLIRIDTSTGQGALIGSTQRLTDLAFHPETHVLYGVNNGMYGGLGDLYTLDIPPQQTPETAAAQVSGGAFEAFAGVPRVPATFIGRSGLGNALGLEFTFIIPEPSSVVGVAGMAAVALLIARRRGKRRA